MPWVDFAELARKEAAGQRPCGSGAAVAALASEIRDGAGWLEPEQWAAIREGRLSYDELGRRPPDSPDPAEPPEPKQRRSRGLGDTIAKGLKLIGVPPCSGCDRRRRLLNRFVPYGPVRGDAGQGSAVTRTR